MELVIDRKVWMRGKGSVNSFLFDPPTKTMCCLGIYGEALGISKECMAKVKVPDELTSTAAYDYKGKAPWLFSDTLFLDRSHLAYDLMIANDETLRSDYFHNFQSEEEREAYIAAKFAEHGVTVVFIN